MVLKEMCRCGGRNGEPKFENEQIKKSVNAVGWADLCNGNPDVVRSNFFKSYEALVEKDKKQRMG